MFDSIKCLFVGIIHVVLRLVSDGTASTSGPGAECRGPQWSPELQQCPAEFRPLLCWAVPLRVSAWSGSWGLGLLAHDFWIWCFFSLSIFGFRPFGDFHSWVPSSAPSQLQLLAILTLCWCPVFSPVIRAMSNLLLPRDIWAEVSSVASLLCKAGILTFPLWLTPYLIGSGRELREWKYMKYLEQCMANGKHPINLNSFLLSSPHYLTLGSPRCSSLLPERQAISVSFFFFNLKDKPHFWKDTTTGQLANKLVDFLSQKVPSTFLPWL